jgi:hypothetical protein
MACKPITCMIRVATVLSTSKPTVSRFPCGVGVSTSSTNIVRLLADGDATLYSTQASRSRYEIELQPPAIPSSRYQFL